MSMQKTVLIGNLGGDPEMRYMPDGKAVTNFSLAVNEDYKNKNGEKVKKTAWFRVSVWGRQAEAANQYLSRGRQVYIEGKLQYDNKTGSPKMFTRQDGTSSSSFELRADFIQYLQGGGGADGDSGSEPRQQQQSTQAKPQIEEDEIPF